MAVVFEYLKFALGRLLFCIRGHDGGQIIYCAAFEHLPEANMTLTATRCGETGSIMAPEYTCLASDGNGKFPELSWNTPPNVQVREYVLICEDIDPPVPFWVVLHGCFFSIPPTITAVNHNDIEQDKDVNGHVTLSGWRFIPNMLGTSYIGPGAPLGHGTHRYIYTVVALNEPLLFTNPDRVTKSQLKKAMVGKVVGWGQWIGHFERPWTR